LELELEFIENMKLQGPIRPDESLIYQIVFRAEYAEEAQGGLPMA